MPIPLQEVIFLNPPPKKEYMILAGVTFGDLVANRYYAPQGVGNDAAAEHQRCIVIPFHCIARNFYVNLTAAPGAGEWRTFTIRREFANTSIVVTIAGTDLEGNDLIHTQIFEPGDIISIRHESSPTVTASRALWGLELERIP